jgi:hypothetical protein
MRPLLLLAPLVLVAACAPSDPPDQPDVVDVRVAEATQRLGASEAGRRVLAAIDAHGGLGA